jgi:hypothetical protein
VGEINPFAWFAGHFIRPSAFTLQSEYSLWWREPEAPRHPLNLHWQSPRRFIFEQLVWAAMVIIFTLRGACRLNSIIPWLVILLSPAQR